MQYCSKKVKVARTRLLSVGFWSWSRFLAVSLRVTWLINLAVGYHYFPPGLQLPLQPFRESCGQFHCLVNRGTMGVNRLTRQCRGCDLNPGPIAPESSTLTTRLPSHPVLQCDLITMFSVTLCVIIEGWCWHFDGWVSFRTCGFECLVLAYTLMICVAGFDG